MLTVPPTEMVTYMKVCHYHDCYVLRSRADHVVGSCQGMRPHLPAVQARRPVTIRNPRQHELMQYRLAVN
jgi:hypothetical protein